MRNSARLAGSNETGTMGDETRKPKKLWNTASGVREDNSIRHHTDGAVSTLPDTPENVAKIPMNTPSKEDEEWEYLKEWRRNPNVDQLYLRIEEH